jgi:L,D-peptidoglycan transpeptidase YkuD (ErfK/YbiS/YcfS/YnhG family)
VHQVRILGKIVLIFREPMCDELLHLRIHHIRFEMVPHHSKEYNKLIRLPFLYKYEKLYKNENIYDIILVLNYNMNPIVKNKGSAIFIHVAKKSYKKTEGCVAVKKVHLVKITKDLKKNTTVLIENQK